MKSLNNPIGLVTLSIVSYFTLYLLRLHLFSSDKIIINFILDLIVLALIVLAIYYLMKINYADIIVKLSFEESSSTFLILISIIAAVFLTLLDIYLISPFNEIIFSNIDYAKDLYEMNIPVLTNKLEYAIVFLSMTVFGPILEEIYFRGFCYNVLRKKFSRNISVILIVIIFLIYHPIPQLIIGAVISSYILCILYEISKTLIPSIIMHSLYNMIAFFQIY